MPSTCEVNLDEIEEIKEILEYMGIQIKKLEEARDGSDKQYTEIAQATDAIRFDYEQLKNRVNNLK